MNTTMNLRMLSASIAVALLSACSHHEQTRDIDAQELARYQRQVTSQEQEINRLKADLAQQKTVIQTSATEPAVTSINDLFPPDPMPGHCYARILSPAQYNTKTEQVLVRETSEVVSVTPAEYNWVEERVMTQEQSSRLEVIPAEYEFIEEQVIVKPASSKLVEIPAEYQEVQESILISPARTEWKRSSSPIAGALQTSRANDGTGEVLCLVEVPAVYETVSKRILASPAKVKTIVVPAEYETVRRKVVKTPAQTREIIIPAEYETRRIQTLVRDATESRRVIPAEYGSVTKKIKIKDEVLNWTDVVCDINMTNSLATDIQQKLQAMGFYKGNIDGIFGHQTIRAVNQFAASKDLPSSEQYIPTETIKKMGLSI